MNARGFTLVELLVVVGIILILAGLSLLAYDPYLARAKAAEADVALREVDRLEVLYFQSHGTYASDPEALGYVDSLRHYTVKVQLLHGGEQVYGIVAAPRTTRQGAGNVVVLTRFRNGTTKIEALSAGGSSTTGTVSGGVPDGTSSTEGTGTGAASGTGGPPTTGAQGVVPPPVHPIDETIFKGGGAGH